MENHWLSWCRLCAKDDAKGNVKVYGTNNDDERQNQGNWDNVLIAAIRKYFEVHMCEDDDLSSVLCTECYTLISELIDFTEHVNKVQAIFEVLRRSDPKNAADVGALRQQYGLLENDWCHIIKPSEVDVELDNKKDICSAMDADIKQEFVDLGVSADCAEYSENESIAPPPSELILEESVTISASANEEVENNPIKRARGRPRTTNLKQLKCNDDDDDAETSPTTTTTTTTTISTSISKDNNSTTPQLESNAIGLKTKKNLTATFTSSEEEQQTSNNVGGLLPSSKRSFQQCTTCKKSYQNPASFQKHVERGCRNSKQQSRSKRDKSRTCELCNKVLSSPGALKLHHEGMHQNWKPFICDCCGKALKTITALNEHKLVHTEERPFVCAICNTGFKNRARLKIHNQIHDKPSFECNICGKTMQTRRTWNMHKLVHNEERKFKCDICKADFKRSKTLKNHLLSHTGLRPYVCNYCGRTFACNANCRSHKLKKHAQEMELEDRDGLSTRISVPSLEELRAMTQKLAKVPNKT